jgi:hypothetical protein
LTLDNDLINIRSKGATERPIKEFSDNTKAALRYINIFLLTIIFIGYGLLRYWLRKKIRFSDEL